MRWNRFITQMRAEHEKLATINPIVCVYVAETGEEYLISNTYHEDGMICIDVEPTNTITDPRFDVEDN